MLKTTHVVLLLCVAALAHASPLFNVANYGAKPDSMNLQTVAIQKAIDAAAVHGGTVMFPPGTYLTGSIFVKTGVILKLDKGVTLLGSQQIADYPMMPTRIAGIEMSWPAALVNIYKQHDAQIRGQGTIDGDGKVFWDSYWRLRKVYEPKGLRWASDYDARRPRLVQIFDSKDIHIGGGLLLRRSGFWTLHLCYSSNVTVNGLTIRNNEGGRGPSTDGIDIDSSNHIVVEHADIAVNDDALCLKAGRDADGLRVARPTWDVTLHDILVRDGAAGVTFGSETSGGFRNIEAFNITTLSKVPVGILFKSAHTRGGFAEKINLHDFTMRDTPVMLRITMNWNPAYSYATIPPGTKDYPDYWKVITTPVPVEKGIAHIRDVHIWNITATGVRTAFEVKAYKEAPLERFHLDHLKIAAQTAGHIADARDWAFSNLSLQIADGTAVSVSDSSGISGLPSGKMAPPSPRPDKAARTSEEQDKN